MPLLELTRELVEAIARQYPTLQTLTLARNALRDLPFLELLPPLRRLDLSDNQLQRLPTEIATWGAALEFLDVTRNALESFQQLRLCQHLVTLRLEGNRVALFSELKYLQPLAQLQELTLQGNPIASYATYRREVLTMLPQLHSLDGKPITQAERLYATLQQKPMVASSADTAQRPRDLCEADLHGDEDDVASQPPMPPPELDLSGVSNRWTSSPLAALSPAASPSSVASSSSRPVLLTPADIRPPITRPAKPRTVATPVTDKKHTQELVRASSRVHKLAPQENESVQLLQSRVVALEKILSLQDTMLHDQLVALGKQRGQPADTTQVERAAELYISLLAAWRHKVVSLMVRLEAAQLQSGSPRSSVASDEKVGVITAELRAQAELWKQKSVDALAQRDLERVKAETAHRQCKATEHKVVKVVRSLAVERDRLQTVAELVAGFASRESMVTAELTVLGEATRRLEAFETRLRMMAERVMLASRLVAHREAKLRNSEAAVEAERRIWLHKVKGDAPLRKGSPLGPMRWQRTQQAVRGVFHRLDPYHTGLVDKAALLTALRGDEAVREALGKKGTAPVDAVEDALRRRSVEGGMGGTITWGELLLVLMPMEDDREEGPLSVEELLPPFDTMGVEANGFAQKEEEREGPLSKQQLQTLSKRDLIHEVLSLRVERSQLQRRIATDARLLQRRAEWIERQWSSKVNGLAIANEELLHSVKKERRRSQELESKLQEAQREAGEAHYQLQSLRRQLSEQAGAFAAQRRELEAQRIASLEQEEQAWEQERAAAVAQQAQLQAENAKLELSVRQLEREIARQREQRERSEAVQVAELASRVQKRDNEIAKLRRERNAILNALREQEKKGAEASAKTVETVATQTESLVTTSTAVQVGIEDEEKGTARSSLSRPDRKLRVEDMAVVVAPEPKALVLRRRDLRAMPRVDPSDLHERLQHLESLTESLLAE